MKVNQTLQMLKELRKKFANRVVARSETTKVTTKLLGQLVRLHEMERQYQNLRKRGRIARMPFVSHIDKAPLSPNELKQLQEARMLYSQILRKIHKNASQ